MGAGIWRHVNIERVGMSDDANFGLLVKLRLGNEIDCVVR
jgi:hypothetical protein